MHKCSFSDPASRSTEKESLAKKKLYTSSVDVCKEIRAWSFSLGHTWPPLGHLCPAPFHLLFPSFTTINKMRKTMRPVLFACVFPIFAGHQKNFARMRNYPDITIIKLSVWSMPFCLFVFLSFRLLKTQMNKIQNRIVKFSSYYTFSCVAKLL